MAETLAPGAAEIHLWLAFDATLRGAPLLARFESSMNAAERARWERFRHEPTRLRHVVARGVQREVLSRYHPSVAPADWRFEAPGNGKPRIAAAHGIRGFEFNLTHTEGLTALAVTRDAALGVDAENVTGDTSLDVARHYFTPAEVAALEDLDGGQRQMRFYELWTLKESWLKATGSGLSTALDRIAFDFAHGAVTVVGEGSGHWHFTLIRPSAMHVLVVAVNAVAAPAIRAWDIGADGVPRATALQAERCFRATPL